MVRRGLVLLATLLAAAAACAGTAAAAVTPVPSLDLSRYVGSWYQLAAIPQFFNRACVQDTTALYTAQPDGRIRVDNRCAQAGGVVNAITGEARVQDPATNAQLQVSFLKLGGAYRYLGGTNYVVIGLADDYSWAVVTDPARISGFVLSRSPSQPPRTIRAIRAVLRANGVGPCRLRWTPVTTGSQRTGAFCLG